MHLVFSPQVISVFTVRVMNRIHLIQHFSILNAHYIACVATKEGV